MRILISGAAGFLGSHLCDLMLSQGHAVIGVDNFVTGAEANVARLAGNGQFTFLRHDVIEPLSIDGPIDRIYHLASPATPNGYLKHKVATLKTNSQGTWNLLELAGEKGARFLLASTSEVYGDPAVNPQREEYWGNVNPIGMRSIYDEGKRFAETCTMAYHRECGADTRIVRIFNTYGPRMDPGDGRVVTTFVRAALRDEPLTIHGDGTQARTLCYVSDTLAGMQQVMEGDFLEPVNLGNPELLTIAQLAREILKLIPQSRSEVAFAPRPDYDPRVLRPDLMRARQLFGWTPRVPRGEGLAILIEDFRQRGMK